jgi:hypothetical protein
MKFKQGGIVSRAIDTLGELDAGASISTKELAEKIGVDRYALAASLAIGVRKGALHSARRGHVAYWQLGAKKPADYLSVVPRIFPAPDALMTGGELGRIVAPPAALRLGTWNSGELSIERGAVRLDLTPAEVETLLAFAGARQAAA